MPSVCLAQSRGGGGGDGGMVSMGPYQPTTPEEVTTSGSRLLLVNMWGLLES